MTFIHQIDWEIFELVQNLWHPALDFIMKALSIVGEGGMIWIALTLILFIPKKTRKTAAYTAAALIVMLLLNNILLKNLFHRVRPFDYDGWPNFIYPDIIKRPSSYSFPSGHTSSSFAAAAAIMITNKKIGVPALIFAAVMGFSRIYLFVHYFSDVLAGAVLGVAYGFIGYLILNAIIKFVDNKRENKIL